MVARGAGELWQGRALYQSFQAQKDHLSVISVIVGTYRSKKTCVLIFEIFELKSSSSTRIAEWISSLQSLLLRLGCHERRYFKPLSQFFERIALTSAKLVSRQVEKCQSIADNSEIELFLPRDSSSAGKFYLLKISSPDGKRGNAATVWLSDEPDRIEGHQWCVIGNRRESSLGLRARLGYTNPIAATPVPGTLLISATTQCNLNCVHCISKFSRSHVSRLSPDLKEHIRQWFRDGHTKIAATDYSGDILWSDHRFGGDIDFLFSLDAPYAIVTNGTHLSRETARRLFKSRICVLVVSLDAAQDLTFRRIRRGAPPLVEILANMKNAAEERSIAERKDVRLVLNFTLMQSNLDEVFDAIRLVKTTGFDCISTNHLEVYSADLARESLWFDQERFNRLRRTSIEFALQEGVELGIPREFQACDDRTGHSFCDEAWGSATILGNGDVQVCCIPGPDMLMGNLHDKPMQEIWNGPRYQRFRELVNSASPPAACSSCPRHRKINNRGSYLLYESVPSPPPLIRSA